MKCFYHPQLDAVALCKHCQKGLCVECSAESGNGMACKNRCETEVKALGQLVLRARNSNPGGSHRATATFSGLAGIVLLYFSMIEQQGKLALFMLLMAVVMFAAALSYYSLSRKLKKL